MTPPQVARHRRALRARRPAPPTKARRDADTCCTAAVRLACSCRSAWGCDEHGEQHGQHEDVSTEELRTLELHS